MRKKFVNLFFVFAFICFSVMATFAQDGWIDFNPPGSGFSIKMQSTPKEYVHELKLGLVMHQYVVEQGDTAYMIGYTDLPGQASSETLDKEMIKKIFDGGRENGLRQAQATLVNEADISLDVFPGREITSKMADGVLIASRLYLIKNRLLMVSFNNYKGPDDKVAKEFFNSLKLVTPGPPPPEAKQQ